MGSSPVASAPCTEQKEGSTSQHRCGRGPPHTQPTRGYMINEMGYHQPEALA